MYSAEQLNDWRTASMYRIFGRFIEPTSIRCAHSASVCIAQISFDCTRSCLISKCDTERGLERRQ